MGPAPPLSIQPFPQTKVTNSITRNNRSILFQLHITGPSLHPLQSQFKSSGQEVIPMEKNESHKSKFNNITKECLIKNYVFERNYEQIWSNFG